MRSGDTTSTSGPTVDSTNDSGRELMVYRIDKVLLAG